MKSYEIREIIEKLSDEEIKEELKKHNMQISNNKIINLISLHGVYWEKYKNVLECYKVVKAV